MPDGTVYVSSNATLPASQIAAHEAVHSYEVRGSEYYAEYEAVISDNVLWGSEPYVEIADHMNDEHYNGKYDIDSIDFAKLFIREVSAYVNQYVSTDMQRANERFSSIFSDWQSVVEASRQFNKNIGADFSGSAFFAPENDAYESVFERLSGADGEADSHKRSNSEFFGTKVLTEEQKAVESVGKALGVGVVFKNLDTSIKKADGKRELFRPNGYYDKSTNTIYINSSRSFEGDALMTIFKHELTHFTENASGPYDAFCDAAKRSKEFRAWLEGKTKRASDKNEDGDRSVDQMMAKLNSDIRELYSRRGIDIGVAGAQREIYADFAGDVLFARNGSAAENIINSLSIKQRPRFIEAIRDFLKFLREKLKGNRDITFGILMLETRYKNAALRAAEVAEVRSDREGGTASGSGKVSYSVEKTFGEQIEDVINGTHNPRFDLYVSDTPGYLIDLNFADGPVLMQNGKISKILSKHSEMSAEVIKQIPQAIKDPILVLKSKTHPKDSVVIVTDILTAKGEMIVPIWANQSGNYIDLELGDVSLKANIAASAYGRNTAALIEFAVSNDGVLYQNPDTNKVSQLLARNGLQLPTPLKLSDSDITVSQNEQSVNSSISGNGNISYSISYTTDNKPVAVIDEDILSGVPKSKWVQTVKNIISEKFTDGIPIGGRLIKVNKITRSEYTNSKYSQYLKSADGAVYQDNLKSANNLDDIVLASTNYINEDLKHSRNDKFTEFARGDVLIRVGGNDYSAKVIVGFTSGNQMVLYDVINFMPASFKIKNEGDSIDLGKNRDLRNESSSDITVSKNEQSVNSSISEKAENDTENREFSVSEEQKTDYGEAMDELLQKYESGEINRDAYNDFVGCSGGNYSNIFTLKVANI